MTISHADAYQRLVFGKYLRYQVPELIEKHEAELNQLLQAAGFTQLDARLLERNSLPKRGRELALLLASFAHTKRLKRFIEVRASPTWEHFVAQKQNRI